MLDARIHIDNVGDNLQLIADFACATMTLLVPAPDGLRVEGSAAPATFSPTAPPRRIGATVLPAEEGEAYACLETSTQALGAKTDACGGITYVSYAYPIGLPKAYGVLVRDVPSGISRDFGPREEAFTGIALQIIRSLRSDAMRDARSLVPFSTTHTGSDAVFLLDGDRTLVYATPNVGSMIPRRHASNPDEFLSDFRMYDYAIASALSGSGCSSFDLALSGDILSVRTIACNPGALVLMEDVTELRDFERELRVKEVTIREVHHRVKNNLQTIESLLRMQMRRTANEEAQSAFSEAIARISAMAVAHNMLAYSRDETVEAVPLARAISEQVMRGVVGDDPSFAITVEGEAGSLGLRAVNSFALAVAEIVHNAFEHGFENRTHGRVDISVSQREDTLSVSIEDDGNGLPDGFSLDAGKSMGLMLMRTLVEDDLSGGISYGASARSGGAAFLIRIPLVREKDETWTR